jgi:hypothetical protein
MEWWAHLHAIRYVYDCNRHRLDWESTWAVPFAALTSDREEAHRYTPPQPDSDEDVIMLASEERHYYDYSYAWNDE